MSEDLKSLVHLLGSSYYMVGVDIKYFLCACLSTICLSVNLSSG